VFVTPAESATNGLTVSLGRPYPGFAMKINSQRPASGGIAGDLELAMGPTAEATAKNRRPGVDGWSEQNY
jgi:hypothetical protein